MRKMTSQTFFERKKQSASSSLSSPYSLNERRIKYNEEGKRLMEVQPSFTPYYSLFPPTSQDNEAKIIKSIYNPQVITNFLLASEEMLKKKIVGINPSVFASLFFQTVFNLSFNEKEEGFLRWSPLPITNEPALGLLLVYNNTFQVIGAAFKMPTDRDTVEKEEAIILLKLAILETHLLKDIVSETMSKIKQQPLPQSPAPRTIQINMPQVLKKVENTPIKKAQEVSKKLERLLQEKIKHLFDHNLPDDITKEFNQQSIDYFNRQGLFVEKVIKDLEGKFLSSSSNISNFTIN